MRHLLLSSILLLSCDPRDPLEGGPDSGSESKLITHEPNWPSPEPTCTPVFCRMELICQEENCKYIPVLGPPGTCCPGNRNVRRRCLNVAANSPPELYDGRCCVRRVRKLLEEVCQSLCITGLDEQADARILRLPDC